MRTRTSTSPAPRAVVLEATRFCRYPCALGPAVCRHAGQDYSCHLCTTDEPPSLDLRAIQEWMLAAITAGQSGAPEHVKGSRGLPAQARIDIYARGYMARLLGCLKAQFPTLLAHTGDTVFNLFATAYLKAHPPSSYSLFDLGAGFPAFLEQTRPVNAGPAGALPAALATLDQLRGAR